MAEVVGVGKVSYSRLQTDGERQGVLCRRSSGGETSRCWGARLGVDSAGWNVELLTEREGGALGEGGRGDKFGLRHTEFEAPVDQIVEMPKKQ